MFRVSFVGFLLALGLTATAAGQDASAASEPGGEEWQPKVAASTASPTATPATAASSPANPAPAAVPAKGRDVALPAAAGQVYREYDISPYTLRVTTTSRPEMAIIDWILRETGYEIWHTDPLAILSASDRVLRVYHTPEVQEQVAAIVDRFVGSQADTYAFSFRIITVSDPSWRVIGQRLLHSMTTRSPGVQSWLLEKEDSAMLLAELRRRSDFREHSSPHLIVSSGQPSIISAMRPRSYVQDLVSRNGTALGYENLVGQLDEGYSAEFVPLLSADGRMIDAFIKCNINQIEKMIPIMLEAPTTVAPRQKTRVEIPQTTQFRFEERFRWPADKVLLIGMGMIALPTPSDGTSLLAGIPLPIAASPPRADVLVFVESRGSASQSPAALRAAGQVPRSYRGRY